MQSKCPTSQGKSRLKRSTKSKITSFWSHPIPVPSFFCTRALWSTFCRPPMTCTVLTTSAQAQRALNALNETNTFVKIHSTIAEAAEKHYLSTGLLSAESTLQWWLKNPTPTIEWCKSWFYLKQDEAKIARCCQTRSSSSSKRFYCIYGRIRRYLHKKDLTTIATLIRDNLIGDDTSEATRRRLVRGTFGRFWGTKFLESNSGALAYSVPRFVDKISFVSFNTFVMGSFFPKVSIVFQNYNITNSSQVYNLDKSDLTPGENVSEVRLSCVFREMKNPVTSPKYSFSYVHRISLLLCARGDGISIALWAVFRGVQEPSLRDGAVNIKVTDMMRSSWTAFWRRETPSMDSE